MKFDWHGQHFDKALNGIGEYALSFISQGYDPGGWFDFIQNNHPDPFAKYQVIYKDLNALWGKTDSESMERFKNLCKAFEYAYKWAISKYIEHLKQEALKGTQLSIEHYPPMFEISDNIRC